MNKLYHVLYRAVLISPFLLFCLLSFALAEKKTADPSQHLAAQTLPGLITVRLRMSDGRIVLASQHDNGMITTEVPRGEKLGITPHVISNGVVTIDFSRIIKAEAMGGRTIVGLGSIQLNSALPRATPLDSVSSIELIGISKVEATPLSTGFGLGVPCPCCVTCGGYETCGVNVTLSCGSCICD